MHIERFVDLGSGAGFPAIPLAVAMPVHDLLMVESIGKKVRFLDAALDVVRQTIDEARIWRTFAGRAEALARDPRHRGRWPAVTARAVGPLADLVELALPLLEPGGTLIAWKAGDAADDEGFAREIAAAVDAWQTIGGVPILVEAPLSAHDTDGTGALRAIGNHRLVLTGRGQRPIDDRWPRDPGERRRRPWS